MKIVSPLADAVLRNDPAGRGYFKATRKPSIHKGVDLLCEPGELVMAPIAGRVHRLGYPYADDLEYRYVEIRNEGELRCRVFYVSPTAFVGDQVEAGDEIGFAQDIAQRYKIDASGGIRYRTCKMLPHVHVELQCTEPRIAAKTREGLVFLDLTLFLELE